MRQHPPQHPLPPSQSGVGGAGANLGEGRSARPRPGSTCQTGDSGEHSGSVKVSQSLSSNWGASKTSEPLSAFI